MESWSTAEVATCPVCGRDHQWEMWVLVNLQDRPDLLVLLQDGSIRHTSCPHCGQDVWSGKPLMVFSPGGFPRALIMTTVDDGQLFGPLSRLFMAAIEDEWRPDDVSDAVLGLWAAPAQEPGPRAGRGGHRRLDRGHGDQVRPR